MYFKKAYLYFFCVLVGLLLHSQCKQSSLLDKPFNLASYNKIVSTKLFNSDEISQHDWFLINYAIKRQKEVYGYDIEGKTYRQILELARSFQKEGLPIKPTFYYNGKQDALTQEVRNIEPGMMRKKDSRKTLKQVINFSCAYTNVSTKAVALETSTFQVFGPFSDHITSLGYEVNCLIKPQQTITINYLVPAIEVTNNLRFLENYYVPSLGIDDFIYSLDIRPSGVSLASSTYAATACKHGNARIEPFKIWDYYKDVDPEKAVQRDDKGNIKGLYLGDAHYIINDAQEIQNMHRIGQGKAPIQEK